MRDGACGRVCLVRHGQTVSNLELRYAGRSAEPLTVVGRQQVTELADRLGSYGVGVVWSSELARAQESAVVLSEQLRVPMVRDPRLNEMLLGPWEGLTEAEVSARYPQDALLWHTQPDRLSLPGRETLDQVRSRISAAVRDAAGLSTPAVLVTHVAPIRVAALTFLGLPLRLYRRFAVENADAIIVEPGPGAVRRLGGAESVAAELDGASAGA